LKHTRKTRELTLALSVTATALTMLSVSTASANTAPFLYAPSLNLVSETSTGAKFTANEVPGATQYEFAWSSQYRWQRSFFYANPPTHGFTITGFLYRALPDSVYHYWVRAIWRSGAHSVFGPWSQELNVTTYPTWQSISQNVSTSVVQISNYSLNVIVNGGYGWGSGFFLPGGYILTCWHVVRPIHNEYWYRQGGGAWHLATLLAYSQSDDLALLKPTLTAPAQGLIGARANPPHVGQPVADIGYPLGRAGLEMPAGGRVSAMQQTIPVSGGVGTLYNMITANVDTYEGDSGSPVLNHWGQVVGVLESGPPYKHFTPAAAKAQDGIISRMTVGEFLSYVSTHFLTNVNGNLFYSYY